MIKQHGIPPSIDGAQLAKRVRISEEFTVTGTDLMSRFMDSRGQEVGGSRCGVACVCVSAG